MRMTFMRFPLLGCLGQERDRARPPDGAGELALVPRAAAGDAARGDLAALGHEVLEPTHVLVVDELHLIHAELADLAPAKPAPLDGLASGRNSSLLSCGPTDFVTSIQLSPRRSARTFHSALASRRRRSARTFHSALASRRRRSARTATFSLVAG